MTVSERSQTGMDERSLNNGGPDDYRRFNYPSTPQQGTGEINAAMRASRNGRSAPTAVPPHGHVPASFLLSSSAEIKLNDTARNRDGNRPLQHQPPRRADVPPRRRERSGGQHLDGDQQRFGRTNLARSSPVTSPSRGRNGLYAIGYTGDSLSREHVPLLPIGQNRGGSEEMEPIGYLPSMEYLNFEKELQMRNFSPVRPKEKLKNMEKFRRAENSGANVCVCAAAKHSERERVHLRQTKERLKIEFQRLQNVAKRVFAEKEKMELEIQQLRLARKEAENDLNQLDERRARLNAEKGEAKTLQSFLEVEKAHVEAQKNMLDSLREEIKVAEEGQQSRKRAIDEHSERIDTKEATLRKKQLVIEDTEASLREEANRLDRHLMHLEGMENDMREERAEFEEGQAQRQEEITARESLLSKERALFDEEKERRLADIMDCEEELHERENLKQQCIDKLNALEEERAKIDERVESTVAKEAKINELRDTYQNDLNQLESWRNEQTGGLRRWELELTDFEAQLKREKEELSQKHQEFTEENLRAYEQIQAREDEIDATVLDLEVREANLEKGQTDLITSQAVADSEALKARLSLEDHSDSQNKGIEDEVQAEIRASLHERERSLQLQINAANLAKVNFQREEQRKRQLLELDSKQLIDQEQRLKRQERVLRLNSKRLGIDMGQTFDSVGLTRRHVVEASTEQKVDSTKTLSSSTDERVDNKSKAEGLITINMETERSELRIPSTAASCPGSALKERYNTVLGSCMEGFHLDLEVLSYQNSPLKPDPSPTEPLNESADRMEGGEEESHLALEHDYPYYYESPQSRTSLGSEQSAVSSVYAYGVPLPVATPRRMEDGPITQPDADDSQSQLEPEGYYLQQLPPVDDFEQPSVDLMPLRWLPRESEDPMSAIPPARGDMRKRESPEIPITDTPLPIIRRGEESFDTEVFGEGTEHSPCQDSARPDFLEDQIAEEEEEQVQSQPSRARPDITMITKIENDDDEQAKTLAHPHSQRSVPREDPMEIQIDDEELGNSRHQRSASRLDSMKKKYNFKETGSGDAASLTNFPPLVLHRTENTFDNIPVDRTFVSGMQKDTDDADLIFSKMVDQVAFQRRELTKQIRREESVLEQTISKPRIDYEKLNAMSVDEPKDEVRILPDPKLTPWVSQMLHDAPNNGQEVRQAADLKSHRPGSSANSSFALNLSSLGFNPFDADMAQIRSNENNPPIQDPVRNILKGGRNMTRRGRSASREREEAFQQIKELQREENIPAHMRRATTPDNETSIYGPDNEPLSEGLRDLSGHLQKMRAFCSEDLG